MIAYFPTPYPDELLYSVLARYYAQSGYLAYTFAAQDLFERKTTIPDIEFVSRLTSGAMNALIRNAEWEKLIKKHTMLPYYIRFLGKERRHTAYVSLMNMEDGYRNLLHMPKSREGARRYLRYCPKCADEDRDSGGETYWHRMHQMPGVNLCAVHFCQLRESEVEICSNGSPSLITAEDVLPIGEACLMSDNEMECRFTEYMADILMSNHDMDNTAAVGDFLHSQMANTKYVSRRGEQRNISILYDDFCEYCRAIPGQRIPEKWQLQKIFSGDRVTPNEICLLAMFLEIPANELVEMKMPARPQQELFDEAVRQMHEDGLNYAEIARELCASYDVVKAIGEDLYGKYHYYSASPQKGGSKRLDWEKIDAETLPKVREIIQQILDNTEDRPVRITVGLIERRLKLPEKRLKNCPKCRKEIERHMLTQEEHWAKVIAWAIPTVFQKTGKVTIGSLIQETNIRRRNIYSSALYLEKYIGKALASELINSL